MNLDIIEDKENPLFRRREIVALVNYGSLATPSKADMQKAIAEQFKASPENVEVTKILSDRGMSKGKAWLKIWHDKKVPIYGQEKAAEQKPAEGAK